MVAFPVPMWYNKTVERRRANQGKPHRRLELNLGGRFLMLIGDGSGRNAAEPSPNQHSLQHHPERQKNTNS